MIHVKQVYADYVEKRREGVSTEQERRQLAHLTAALNVETQKHLANLFKYAEERVRSLAMAERKEQLEELQRLKEAIQQRPNQNSNNTNKKSSKRRSKKQRIKQSISAAIGLDVGVVDSMLSEMEAQEKFMQFCEVFARLTVGRGFTHTAEDEGLDAYTESMKKLYSVDAGTMSTLEAVQYMAAKESVPPVEWARRWYERAVLLPLQQTPEYKRLEEIRTQELEALKLRREIQQKEEEGTPSEERALVAGSEAARLTEEKTVQLVEKMFMKKDDARLQSIHERRLKYLAYLQLERQIEQSRENAKLFEGVETSPEADVCHTLYEKMMDRRRALQSTTEEDTNVFRDEEMASLFEQIREVVLRVIEERQAQRKVDRQHERRAAVASALRGVAQGEETASEQLRQVVQAQKQSVGRRLLGILENDVQHEMQWLQSMEEAERPPLLPVPRPMSYVSAADVASWRTLREEQEHQKGDPFQKHKKPSKGQFAAELLAQRWPVPDKPLLFWGTGSRAVQQALRNAAEDADRRRRGEALVPPYPCAENPWGWRLAKDILDDDD
ncbi:trichohyalin [Angomonas deanei]|uniref:Trichohyalin n=1 Tax=Angomonas deanei TaxID=59799 RepID=A0A7G2CB21_9TRYP|nr:trichohyalin [Angomonas deanei]CAD2216117.1 hypothetical protein, conserved [Angomonas deanei]|eukprot:EPY31066.1 trichohyalin [Angomonas deanei]